MNKKEELMSTMDIVYNILISSEKSRDSDLFLYKKVMNTRGYSVKMTFEEVVSLIENKELPTFTTVRRCRAKIQELHQELRPSKACNQSKDEWTSEFIEMSHIANY